MTINGDVSVVLEDLSFTECPRWHEGRLWFSDFYTHSVIATDGRGSREVIAQVPQQPSGLGFLPDGRLLIVSMRDHKILRREPSGELVEHADLSGLVSEHLNDMVVDADGSAYVGNFGFDLMGGAAPRTTTLTLVGPDGSVRTVADDLAFPNGMVIADGVLVVAESFGGRLTAFDIAADHGLTNRRTWAEFGTVPDTANLEEVLAAVAVVPDGICRDAEGAVWVADATHARVVRVREGGEIAGEISTAPQGVFACMLGGEDGRTLFLCAAPSFAEHERRDVREAQLLAVRVDVPHAGLP
jgi:sugar lactone lactonase YvrE